jgi:hypothetical protein
MRTRLALLTTSVTFLALLLLTPPAAADNCDIFISPQDCQNTGWTIGVIATIAGGVAVAAAATTMSGGQETEKQEPGTPPGGHLPKRPERKHSATGNVDVRPIFDPPRIDIGPSDRTVRHRTIALEVRWDQGWQTVREVPRDHT